ncbi:Haloacid dehalogenase domain protein hydrolase [Nitrosotalea devaniterrae]|uniref:Haloacid dehalogenase domain protein hydrolase n=1 Tax=Nitrosotalea devaniterrae TaxID=1078905 RepID=A0A128A5R6_9ARCH|nr:Haloacid dehalogenase domain protein hydrolase [Candidatus Nitrosotalea devanaterra]
MTLKEIEEGIIIDPTKIEKIKKLDSIVFDCDGVLIDVSNSYDLTIKKTVDFIIKEMAQVNESDLVTTKLIEGFKASGGFNDEIDVTYALILAVVAAKKRNEPFSKFIIKVIENADQTGIKSVEKYLNALKVDISDIREKLAYPGKKFQNLLSSIFDEIFYGSELYLQLYKKKPQFFDGLGLIENDIVLLNRDLVRKLHDKFDKKIAIVTGRGNLSAKYSLKDLFNEFDLSNSKFLEDEPREMAKPNPHSLISTIKGMNGNNSLYVGDSMEDYIMARKADESGISTIFCGVYGTSKDPEAKKSLFENNNADIIVKSIDLIPKTLNLVEA